MKLVHFTRILPHGNIPMAVNPAFVELVQSYLEVDSSGNQGPNRTFKPSTKKTTLVIEGFAETVRNLESADD